MAFLLPLEYAMQPNKLSRSFKLLMSLAIAGALAAVGFYRGENSVGKSPTEYVKAQPIKVPPSDSGERQASIDRGANSRAAAVEKPDVTAKKLSQAWNQGTSQEIANLFTSDGELIIPNGSTIRSKPEIEKTIDEKRAGLLKETNLSSTVEDISQIDPETAIVKGRYELAGIKILGFNKAAGGTFVLRQQKVNGRWLISKAEVKSGDPG
jgi:uncharacterized protein (TIGR02246 family)